MCKKIRVAFIITESGSVKSHQASVSLDSTRCLVSKLLSVVKAVGSGGGLPGPPALWGVVALRESTGSSFLKSRYYFRDATNLRARSSSGQPGVFVTVQLASANQIPCVCVCSAMQPWSTLH